MTFNSERAEQTEARVNRALAHYRVQVQADQLRSPSGRMRRGTVGSAASSRSFQAQDAILRLVAIAEEFSIGRFVDVIEALLPADQLVSALWDAELDRSSDTWGRRNTLWKRYRSVDISAFALRDPLEGFIEARNSIAHGLGDLTRKQLRRRASAIEKLRRANVGVQGTGVVIADTDVEHCARVVNAYIAWLDASS